MVKHFLFRKNREEVKEAHANDSVQTAMSNRTKYKEYDAFSLRGTILGYGLMTAVFVTLVSFAWTQYEKVIDLSDYDFEIDEIIEQEPPRSAEPPPPPPPPPPPIIQEVPDDEIEEDPPPLEDMSVTEETVIDEPKPVVDDAPPPPPPPPPPPAKEEIFKRVEEMPRFPGCEDMKGTDEEKYKCSQVELLKFVQKNLKYPAIAKENGVQGTIPISFTVGKDGSITDVTVLRGLGAGLDEAAVEAVESITKSGIKFRPGKQRGRAVKVSYTLPIRFKLEG